VDSKFRPIHTVDSTAGDVSGAEQYLIPAMALRLTLIIVI